MLKIEHMCKVFNPNTINENRVFDDFSLQVDKGDFVMEQENLLFLI